MPWRSARTLRPAMLMTSMLKNLISGNRPAVQLLENLRSIRALNLVAIASANDSLRLRV